MEFTTTAAFLQYRSRIHARTAAVVNCIPAEHLEWRYKEDKFSMGDQIRHLAAIERYMFAENFKGRPSSYPGHGTELASGLEATLAYFHKMHDECTKIYETLTAADMQAKCTTPGGGAITVWKWLRAMLEHEIHHRAQIYMMLGMLDVATPPLYGLTSEEVKERSK